MIQRHMTMRQENWSGYLCDARELVAQLTHCDGCAFCKYLAHQVSGRYQRHRGRLHGADDYQKLLGVIVHCPGLCAVPIPTHRSVSPRIANVY